MGKGTRAVLTTTVLAAGFVFNMTSVAVASCAEPLSFEEATGQATAVFVGTVVESDFGGRVATFEVTEVWKGSVPAEVVVNGGPAVRDLEEARANGLDLATSVDRSYLLGGTYVVFAQGTEGGVLFDNSCSNTRELTDEIADLRPDTATVPAPLEPVATTASPVDGAPPAATTAPNTTSESINRWWLAGLAAAAVAASATVVARRRHRRTAPQWRP